ncbi:RNA polymerase Rpc34 subunit-domain-containing protein [Suillus fuscotomentosus]|uniref:RNA polymerase Rpc34 subunit-domain-containing protein n=1 Tax=Suillus fuscotomentosus TaxID=1912939 RepID=A0AAD4EPE1_9AGAM|nr:RNA polymerase Rpc34 subunit-domain-containing protein [Suillus fuscotomentosus]KAG1908388.1 RNA polymerase Rpc34 subunit-domain-containing protein [Suillus fuscotomentosus]
MSGRKLNPEEQKLHQAALSSTDKASSILPITHKYHTEAEKIVPDVSARTAAVNFLLGAGMLKVLSNAAGVISFRAVMKKEIEVKKDMSGEEAMVLGHIQASANEGIWTKHLKAKTELHQTVIDRCLKSLVQKQLVKAIKAVRHPTRKIYMLAHLEPSVELTGGPWYTDNELDTEFIKLLSTACLHYIRDRSFPKQSSKAQNEYRLYSISAAPSYPSAQHIQHFLSKSKITETQLGVEHVEMLLRVLELDGEIEKASFLLHFIALLPAFTASAWDATVDSDDSVPGSSSDSDSDTATRKKRKRSSSKKKKERKTKTRKRRRTEESGSSSESDDDDESEEEERQKRKRKRSKKEESDEEEDHKSKKNKKRKSREKEDESESEDSDDDDRTSSTSKRKRKGKKLDDSSDDDSESESDSDHRRSKSKSSSKLNSKRVKFESPEADDNINVGGAFVYRAIRQERVALGWSQAPCGRCPVFDFCRDKGPTNPQECVYYEEWLNFKGPGVVKVDV